MSKCPICGYEGQFEIRCKKDEWHPIEDFRCPRCKSLNRHRLIWLILQSFGYGLRRVLHWSPMKCLKNRLEKTSEEYVTADFPLRDGRGEVARAMLNEDLRKTSFKDNCFDLIICSHVLDAIKEEQSAIKELYRITAQGGVVIVAVPIYEEIKKTEELAEIGGCASLHWRKPGLDYFERFNEVEFDMGIYKGKDFKDAKIFKVENEIIGILEKK